MSGPTHPMWSTRATPGCVRAGARVVCQPERTKADAGSRSLSTFKEKRSKDSPLARVSFLWIKKIINNNGLDQLSQQTGEPELGLIGDALFPLPIRGDVRVCAALWQVATGTNGNGNCKRRLPPEPSRCSIMQYLPQQRLRLSL